MSLTANGRVEGQVRAFSTGGDGTGSGGLGGVGGDVTVTIGSAGYLNGDLFAYSTGGDSGLDDRSGAAGKVVVTVAGTVTGRIEAVSVPGDRGDTVGGSNDVTITITGTVVGNIDAKSIGGGAKTVQVNLDGGVVTGQINATGSATNILSFAFDVADKADFNAASTALTGPASSGTVTINSHTYTWSGFDSPVNLLRYTGPSDTVVVSVTPAAASTAPGDAQIVQVVGKTQPQQEARCTSTTVKAIRQTDGSVSIYWTSGDGSSVPVGKLVKGSFQRAANAPAWTVSVANNVVQVSDSTGGSSTSCSF